MLPLAFIVCLLAASGGCLLAMGVSAGRLVELLAALLLMTSISSVLAWLFLRKGSRRD